MHNKRDFHLSGSFHLTLGTGGKDSTLLFLAAILQRIEGWEGRQPSSRIQHPGAQVQTELQLTAGLKVLLYLTFYVIRTGGRTAFLSS